MQEVTTMTQTMTKPPERKEKTTYIVKDVFKEQDPDKRNEKVVEIIKKHIKKSRWPPTKENNGTNQKER